MDFPASEILCKEMPSAINKPITGVYKVYTHRKFIAAYVAEEIEK
jgi:hypothetical protein